MATIEILVEGGKASATPQMAQQIGPLGIKIPDVLAKINEKTASFKGMKVPVKINVDEKTKAFTVEVGTPPASQLIFKELNIKKGSPKPDKIKTGNLAIEQVIKIAKMKQDSLFAKNLKQAVKTIAGSCNSLGVLIENKTSAEICKDIDAGKFDTEIKEEKTEPSPEKLESLKKFYEEVKEKQKIEEEKIKKALEEKAALATKPAEAAEKPTGEEEKKEEKK